MLGLTGSITGLTLLALWDPIPTPDMASWGPITRKEDRQSGSRKESSYFAQAA
jgi:hypothetical protein